MPLGEHEEVAMRSSVETRTISVGKREVCVEAVGDPGGHPILMHSGSTVDRGHSVASGAEDVRAIAAALGHDRLGVAGLSGGGPYALGCEDIKLAISDPDSAHDGLSQGDQGWWDDGMSRITDWGFKLEDIRVPVKIWHGRQHRYVPVQHGEWLASNEWLLPHF